MANEVRVCYLFVEDPLKPGSGELVKAYTDWYLPILEAYFRQANLTYVRTQAMGVLQDAATLAYDGCAGLMQQNKSDVVMAALQLADYGPNISTQATVLSDYTIIVSAYRPVDEKVNSSSTRVMDFVKAYSPTHWFLTAFLTLTLCILMWAVIRIRGKTKTKRLWYLLPPVRAFDSVSKILISCMLNQHSNCGTVSMNFLLNCLYTFLTILGFYSAFFLTSMIKTEMVVLHRPETYDTYQDLLDHDVTPFWLEQMNEHRPFKEGRLGSMERKIWDRAVKRGLNQSVFSVTKGMAESGMRILTAAARREAASLSVKAFVPILISNACAFLRQNGLMNEANIYMSVDPDAIEFLRVQLSSALMSDKWQKQYRKGFMISCEMGTFLVDFHKGASFLFAGPKGHFVEVEQCMSGQIVMPDNVMMDVPLPHYWDLITLYLLALILSACVLIWELCWPRNIPARIQLLLNY